MSAPHTPGPWKHEPVPHQHGFGGTTFHIISLTHDGIDTRSVAFTGGSEAKANARLIAAAPEMLALLQRFERFSAGTGFVYPLGSLQELRTLIAKATGSAS